MVISFLRFLGKGDDDQDLLWALGDMPLAAGWFLETALRSL
jgi:hypothetical protein